MLIQATHRSGTAHVINGAAHIVISLDARGRVAVESMFNGEMDSVLFGARDDRQLLDKTLPMLLAELRDQLTRSGST